MPRSARVYHRAMATPPQESLKEPPLRPRLLIADRNAAEAARAARFFEGEGYEVLAARTGEQAFNILERQAVDGILAEARAAPPAHLRCNRHASGAAECIAHRMGRSA